MIGWLCPQPKKRKYNFIMRGQVVGNAKTDYWEVLKYGKREIVFYRWRQLGGEVVEMQEVGKGTNPPRQSGRVVHFWQAADYHDRQSQQDDHRMIRWWPKDHHKEYDDEPFEDIDDHDCSLDF